MLILCRANRTLGKGDAAAYDNGAAGGGGYGLIRYAS